MAVATQIKAAAVTAISALALTPTPDVVARKTAVLPSGKQPPAVVVACGEGGDTEPLWHDAQLVRYPLTVAVYVATKGDTTDDDLIETWRQEIARKLNDRASYAGVTGTGRDGTGTGVNEVERRDETTFDPPALTDGYNVSFMLFTVETIEPRN